MAIATGREQTTSSRIIGKRSSRLRLNKVHLHCAYCICLRPATKTVFGSNSANYQQDPPYHVTFKYLNPLLLGIIGIRTQVQDKVDPFTTHPLYMWIFISTVCIYFLIVGKIKDMNANHYLTTQQYLFLSNLSLVNGALSSVSLACILLPPLFGWIVLGVWAVLAIIVSRHFCIWICWISASYAVKGYQWIMKHFSKKTSSIPK